MAAKLSPMERAKITLGDFSPSMEALCAKAAEIEALDKAKPERRKAKDWRQKAEQVAVGSTQEGKPARGRPRKHFSGRQSPIWFEDSIRAAIDQRAAAWKCSFSDAVGRLVLCGLSSSLFVDDAPEEVKKAFADWQQEHKKAEDENKIL